MPYFSFRNMKLMKELVPYFLIIISIIMIRTFIVTPVRVSGSSMDPTLAEGEILILKKYDHSYERFDIVVLKHWDDKIIKRIIGLPGETIEYKNNKLYINGKETKDVITSGTEDFTFEGKIPEGYYFVLGDNRGNSADSRRLGLFTKEDIEGITTFAIWPFQSFGFIE